MTEESSDLKIKPDAAGDLSEEPSALPTSEDGYGLSGKALRDYLFTMKIACDAPGMASDKSSEKRQPLP